MKPDKPQLTSYSGFIFMEKPEQTAADFVQFCVRRCGRQWPSLYDEMCRVAAGRLFKGMGYAELRRVGLHFGLGGIEKTARLLEGLTGSTTSS
jgi:hypothetical protein